MIRHLLLVKNFFVENFHLKLTSVLLAFLLWITINGEPKSAIGFKVSLEYRNYPKGIEVIGDSLNTIDVRLSASSRVVKRLDPTDITAVIDLSNWSLGERTYSITPANIKVPFGVSITKITPNQVRLKFERTQQKSVEIHPHIIGKVPEGYQIKSVNCHPNMARIEGPESRLGAVDYVSTDSVNVTGRSQTLRTRAHLSFEDPLVRFSDEQETNVEVVIVPVPSSYIGRGKDGR